MHTGQFYEKAELDIAVSYLTYLPKFKTKKVEKMEMLLLTTFVKGVKHTK